MTEIGQLKMQVSHLLKQADEAEKASRHSAAMRHVAEAATAIRRIRDLEEEAHVVVR